jgi:hypothetical protein
MMSMTVLHAGSVFGRQIMFLDVKCAVRRIHTLVISVGIILRHIEEASRLSLVHGARKNLPGKTT